MAAVDDKTLERSQIKALLLKNIQMTNGFSKVEVLLRRSQDEP